MTGSKERGIAYSLILCASLSMNCLTTQTVWALDSADASKAAPPAGAATSGTPAPAGSATAPTATAPAAAAAAPATTSTGTPASPPAGSPATAASTVKSAPGTTAASPVPTVAGPLQSDRNNIRNWMLAAQKRGVGIGGYMKVYDDMENSVKAGEPQANIKKKVDSMCHAIADQYHTSSKVHRDTRVGVRTGGSVPYQILYDGNKAKFKGKVLDQGVVSECQEIEHKKALEKLRYEEREGMFTGDALEARRDLNRQREEMQWILMERLRSHTGQKVPTSAFIDNIRKSNTGAYYEKSKLRREQQQHAKQELDERYGKRDWIQPPYNQGDY